MLHRLRVRRGLTAVAGVTVLAILGGGCGGSDAPRAARSQDAERAYQEGLDTVLHDARDARDEMELRRSYDLGFNSGAEEAVAVNARSTEEMRRLGCTSILPQVAFRAERARRPPPTAAELCPIDADPVMVEVLAARHHGPAFERGKEAASSIARESGDRRLGELVFEAYGVAYELGYRSELQGWDEERSHGFELQGCRAAVARAISEEWVTVFEREDLLARCDALPVHRLGF